MRLGEKIRYLRDVEGSLRGMGRALKQQELVELVKSETGNSISQSYLSQIENGSRPHLTNKTRTALAQFFKVHPGFLVNDPEGFSMNLVSDLGGVEGQLDLWCLHGAERFRHDEEVSETLTAIAREKETRLTLLLLGHILKTPGLAESLRALFERHAASDAPAPRKKNGKRSNTVASNDRRSKQRRTDERRGSR